MVSHHFKATSVSSFLAITLIHVSASFSAVVATFDVANQFANEFTPTVGNGLFSDSSTGGITGGNVNVGFADKFDVARYNSQTYVITQGVRLETSVDWLYDSATNNPLAKSIFLQLGFSRADSTFDFFNFNGSSIQLDESSNSPDLVGIFGFSGSTDFGPFFPIPSQSGWYRTTFSIESIGGPFSQFDLFTKTENLGADGLQPSSTLPQSVLTRSLSSSTLNGVALASGFATSGFSGIRAFDNFSVSVTAVPEPNAFSLCITIFSASMLRRKRTPKVRT